MALLPSQQTPLPTGPTTDVLGGITPAGLASAVGVNTLANPANSVSSKSPMLNVLKAKNPDFDPNALVSKQPVPSDSTAPVSTPPPVSAFAQTLAKKTDDFSKVNSQVVSAPGGWARAILGGAMGALGGLEVGLGDAAAASENVPEGGGALTGITRTLAARNQRLAAQREEISKEKTADLLRAETMQRIASATRNQYRQDQQDRTAAYANNSSYMTNFRKKYDTSDDQDNITQDQLNDMLRKNPDFWRTHTGRAVGEEPVMDGGKQKIVNGEPVFSPLFSISRTAEGGAAERTSPISEDEATFIKNNTGVNVSPNTELTSTQYDNLMVRARSAHDTKQMVVKANDEDMSEAQARQLNQVMQDPRIQHYMSMNPGEPLGGLYDARKNVEAHVSAIDQMIQNVQQKVPTQPGQPNPTIQALQQKRQEFVQEGQNIDKAVSGFNEKAKDDYTKRQDELRKQQEVERHNRMDEANKAAELAAKKGKFDGDPDAPTPEAFLNSLDPTARSTVQLIGTGRAPLNNPGYLLARKPEIISAVTRAYPDFEPNKIGSYQKKYDDYTTGKTSVQLKAGPTAMKHLRELYNLNTVASHIPGTPAYTAYKNKAETLSAELGAFYGTTTKEGIDNIKETLMSTLPGTRQSAIKTQVGSMIDRLDTLKSQWDEAAPSKEYAAQMPSTLSVLLAQRGVLDTVGEQTDQGQNPNQNNSSQTPSWGSQFGAKPRGQ